MLKVEDYTGTIKLLKSMEETVDTWNYINKLPLSYLIQDIDLSIQCIMFNIGNLNVNRINEICRALEEKYKGNSILDIIQFVYIYIGEKAIISIPKMMTVEQVDSFNLSPVTQSVLFVEFANVLLEENLYSLTEQFIDRAIRAGGESNICVYFYGHASKAQLLEEIGRLNDSLVVYSRLEALMKSPSVMASLGFNYYVGIIGVYHKRMDKENAKKAIEETKRIFNSNLKQPLILQSGYDYHIAEFEFLFGDPEKGIETVNKMFDEYKLNDILQFDRLLCYMHANNVLESKICDRFINDYNNYVNNQTPLSVKLLYARIIYQNGDKIEAFKLLEEVIVFSRKNKNMLRLVEADLLKIKFIVSDGEENKRKINNLLREAIYYSWENNLKYPYYMDRIILYPYLEQYSKASYKDLSEGELKFLKEILILCSCNKNITDRKNVLSTREQEVLKEIAKGLTNPEIAEKLCISLSTVKTHIINIYGKLGVSSRLLAIEESKNQGLL